MIFRHAKVLFIEEPLPLLDEEEGPADKDVDDGDLGRIGSGIR